MKIDQLIEELQTIQYRYGNLECVQEAEDFYHNMIHSTIESLTIVNYHGEKAVRIDWRTL